MFKAASLILLLAASPLLATDTFWQKQTWTASDGVKIEGLYHPASNPQALTWVLLHGLGSNRDEWAPFARKLAKQGNGILIYDARGHFRSTKTSQGKTIRYQDWKSGGQGTPWALMPEDLAVIIQALSKKTNMSEDKIAVGGASLGANVALVYAAARPAVPAVILLSPGAEYAGIASAPAYQAYRRPVFMAATPADGYSYLAARQLAAQFPNPAQFLVEAKSGHGVNMFVDETFTKALLDWIKVQDGNRNRRPT